MRHLTRFIAFLLALIGLGPRPAEEPVQIESRAKVRKHLHPALRSNPVVLMRYARATAASRARHAPGVRYRREGEKARRRRQMFAAGHIGPVR